MIQLLSLLTCAFAIDGVVTMNMERVSRPNENVGRLNKRAASGSSHPLATILDNLENQRFFYTTNCEVGTPAQKVNLLLDTGSSDTWVFGPQTTDSSFMGQIASLFGGQQGPSTTIFDPSKSSTFKKNDTQLRITYGIGNVQGNWGMDKFSIAGTTLDNLSIGVATQASQINQGIIGIGRKQAESTLKTSGAYNNLPWQLKQEGKIRTAAYSLYLNDINAGSGTILFGGIDHGKYTGELVNLDISHPRHLAVQLQGIYTDGREQSNNMGKPMSAILDSGTSLTYLPQDVLTNIRTALNANPSFTIGTRYYTDCNITTNLVLDFGEQKINVPSYQFLWPIDQFVNGVAAATAFPQNSCYLGLEQSDANADYILLGDNVIRSMYIVYDLEHNKIGLAQGSGSSSSNIEAIVH